LYWQLCIPFGLFSALQRLLSLNRFCFCIKVIYAAHWEYALFLGTGNALLANAAYINGPREDASIVAPKSVQQNRDFIGRRTMK